MSKLFDELRENEIEAPAKEYAKMRNWVVIKIEKSHKNGMPDDLFIRRGQVIFMEFKAPGEHPTKQQKKRHKEIRDQGIPVFVIDDLDVAKTILR